MPKETINHSTDTKTIIDDIDVICVQVVADIIALAFQSTFVSNESNGVNLLLIANAESAKTTIAHKFVDLPFVTYYDDVSQKSIVDDFLPSVRHNNKKTLIIPDLVNSVEKQKVTRSGLLNMLKSGIDDTGITELNSFHMKLERMNDFKGTKFNLVTAITSKALIQGSHLNLSLKKIMINSGLMTRFLPFSYNYPPSVKQKIKNVLFGGDSDPKDIVKFVDINQRMTYVESNPMLLQQFDGLANEINADMEFSGYGFRALTLLRRLAKANALLNHRTELEQADIDRIMHLGRFMNFKCGDI